ncbi:UTP--glucose-1-phosphate uridylyltransferase [Mycoplasma feriruminatoris]|uniref:UTP--glucose-1-phosphate uridylyltransferase n=1 Tax=Mycoplasma feriruminatoris TaxID=1179777 RepID=UPI00241C0E91|nr:UTP--glucose-1-phosphate uridylyltransferase [Mycoplasma feriruminatoris]WFQ94052.1 UTP--glucose-1-phosphate uridylyltransferase [Mycoplasma feriruminatoris]
MTIKKAVIPCAGFGTRFLPFTKSQAKEMLPIIDTPTIEYIVKEAVDSGVKEILIVLNDKKSEIMKYFSRNIELERFLYNKEKIAELEQIKTKFDADIHYIMQDEQLGLGHAISLCKGFVDNEPFAVLLGDDLFKCNTPAIKQLIDLYEEKHSTILGTILIDKKDSKKYGICQPETSQDNICKVCSVIEKPEEQEAPSNIAIAGRYILTPEIFKYLDLQLKGKTGEIELTDSILKTIGDVDCYAKIIDGKRYDIGNKLGYLEAFVDFALDREDTKNELIKIISKVNEQKEVSKHNN